MAMSRAIDRPYIVLDPRGEPVIRETRVPVRAIVVTHNRRHFEKSRQSNQT